MKLELKLSNKWLEATWYTEENETKTQVHCESFSGHPEHIAMLKSKALEYGTELDEVIVKELSDSYEAPTQAELDAIAKEQAKQEALTKIATLEASQLRSIRELMLDPTNAFAKTKLEDIEAQIQAERLKL